MNEELLKKLNTTGAFDTPWLKQELQSWDAKKELQKADFMEHIYQVYRPTDHTYTGLWGRFCMTEAGPTCRDLYFERLEAIEKYLEETKNVSKETVEVS
jgi:hypothetical protein